MNEAKWVIGIGSPHGEDRAGWEVIERLERRCFGDDGLAAREAVTLRKAAVPHDILDWLTADATVHLIDANIETKPQLRRFVCSFNPQPRARCAHTAPRPRLRVKRGPSATETDETLQVNLALDDPQFPGLRSGSSHQIDLISTLQLAATLDLLPPTLVLWAIGITADVPLRRNSQRSQLTELTDNLVHQCARRIAMELSHA